MGGRPADIAQVVELLRTKDYERRFHAEGLLEWVVCNKPEATGRSALPLADHARGEGNKAGLCVVST